MKNIVQKHLSAIHGALGIKGEIFGVLIWLMVSRYHAVQAAMKKQHIDLPSFSTVELYVWSALSTMEPTS